MFYKNLTLLISILVVSINFAVAEEVKDEFDMSPEEFFSLDMNVVSPAKKLQKLKNVPSAVYVLTEEDIQRSAATNVMELLRLVPGLQVAKTSSHEWAISSRGSNFVFSDKILLLIDGTPEETLIFNGVYWENINLPLDVIERIEVIRGPGAAVWGTRAVNGIIHIITKDAYTHPHNAVSAGGGNEHQASVYARTGKVISENAAVSAYVKYDQRDGSKGVDGTNLNDDWNILSVGLRGDFNLSDKNKLRVTSNISNRQADVGINVPSLVSPPAFSNRVEDQRDHFRATMAFSLDREVSEDSQMSFEWTNFFEDRKDFTLEYFAYYSDIEFRHRYKLNGRNDLTYGANVRFYFDNTEGSDSFVFDPENRSLEFYRLFFHDEITLIPEELTLTIGSRFEQNAQVGFNVLPTARLLWSVNEKVSVWSSFSYTTGNPTRFYDNATFTPDATVDPTTGLPVLLPLIGNTDVDTEELLAYEIGIWAEPAEDLYVSATAFYFSYDDLISRGAGMPFPNLTGPVPFIVAPLNIGNELEADSVGFELAMDWSATDSMTFSATYSLINIDVDGENIADIVSINLIDSAPQHTATIRGHFDLTKSLETDLVLRYVDKVPNTFRVPEVDSYFTVDLQARWFITPNLDLKVIGRNLVEDGHEEFSSVSFNTPLSEVERSVFGELRYTF